MENCSLIELNSQYEKAISILKDIHKRIEDAWDIGDKRQAKNLECASDEHIETLFEVEEKLTNYCDSLGLPRPEIIASDYDY